MHVELGLNAVFGLDVAWDLEHFVCLLGSVWHPVLLLYMQYASL